MKIWMTAIVFALGTAFGLALVGTYDHAYEVSVPNVTSSGSSDLNQVAELFPPERVITGAVEIR